MVPTLKPLFVQWHYTEVECSRPTNLAVTRRWINIVLTLVHSLRRWTNVKPFIQRRVSAGKQTGCPWPRASGQPCLDAYTSTATDLPPSVKAVFDLCTLRFRLRDVFCFTYLYCVNMLMGIIILCYTYVYYHIYLSYNVNQIYVWARGCESFAISSPICETIKRGW